jgi:hypothetical protein
MGPYCHFSRAVGSDRRQKFTENCLQDETKGKVVRFCIATFDVLEELYDRVLSFTADYLGLGLGYSTHLAATLNAVITGLVVTGFSTWGMNQFMHLGECWGEHYGLSPSKWV